MPTTTATRYHIGRNNKPAVCTAASEASCPMGGQHFGSKDEAEFYTELHGVRPTEAPLTALFPATFNNEWIAEQARAYWQQDGKIGEEKNMYIEQGGLSRAEAASERKIDYEIGFESALRRKGLSADEAFKEDCEQFYWQEDEVDRGAWQMGFNRGQRLLTASPADFLRKPIDDEDYKPEEGKYATTRFLKPQFTLDEKVHIPGNSFRLKDYPKQGEDLMTKIPAGNYRVVNVYPASIEGSSFKRRLRPAILVLAGPNNKRLNVPLTPEILVANEKPLVEIEPRSSVLIHKPINED